MDTVAKPRLDYMDTAKAIAILLVVVGHSFWLGKIPYMSGIIYSFHMPLFFIISGFFFKNVGVRAALKKYAMAYLWPYLVLCVLIMMADVIGCIREGGDLGQAMMESLLKGVWASNGVKDTFLGDIPHIGAAWFLFALFWACFFLTVVERYLKPLDAFVCVLFAACFSLLSIKVIELPFSIQAGMLSLMYVYIGAKIRKYQLVVKAQSISLMQKTCACCFWVVVAVGVGGVDLGSSYLGYSIIAFTNSIFGVFIVIVVCMKMKCGLGWLGRSTLYVYGAHILTYQYFKAFGLESCNLPYSPLINLLLENAINLSLSLAGGYVLSKTKILKYPLR